MSPEAAKRKKVDAPLQRSASVTVSDHRKRRRNRTTQSCLNCHSSKRMCDRKRPCGRCIQLGIVRYSPCTGLCMYEVDDPGQRTEAANDKTRLQMRVAELEGVIRELKNKPHPRWTQSSSDTYQIQAIHSLTSSTPFAEKHASKTSQGEPETSGVVAPSPPPNIDISMVSKERGSRQASLAPPPLEVLLRPRSPTFMDPFSVAPSSSSDSPLAPDIDDAGMLPLSAFRSTSPGPGDDAIASLLSYFMDGDLQPDTPFAELFDNTLRDMSCSEATPNPYLPQHSGQQTPLSECGCLSEVANYQAVLELSLRLRCAAEALNRHPRHNNSSMCLLKQRIAELDVFTSNTLRNIDTPGMNRYLKTPPTQMRGLNSTSEYASPDGWTGGSTSSAAAASAFPSTLARPSDESLVSWTPQRHRNMSISLLPNSWRTPWIFPRKF
ncbi:hypothetical protein EDB92DRAFT_812891 [Lactarius akahatsu]|uniref:Zn(2)-C6 fungal-type domain-containing protein n=1 Tax=Lactarius akahatsu TaxID=416441 RepID=A0AAD4LGA1_9AGAM|nr:hypothetical protein EDB92DRAFT_812891 [Lactarius akahatsu]